MSDIIKLLPDSVANQIAAGEVVQRPASAVKELLENAVDSGANSILLVLRDAGKSLIQVTDNGSGMSASDARMSLERHATSKIQNADDLFAIRTLGFRGEAMASIAAISQLEIKTRKHDEELASHLIVEGSEVKSQEYCASPVGTTMIVKNLFFNVPARRKFLKSIKTELKNCKDEFIRIAMVYPDIQLEMVHDNQVVFKLPASSLKQRIVNIMGSQFEKRLLPIDADSNKLSLKGFIGRPEFARKSRNEQFIFVNGRFVRSPYLSHAVGNAYMELIPENFHPAFFIYIQTDPQEIDINIHPTKTEVKFSDEQLIYAFIQSASKQAIGKFNVAPEIDFEDDVRNDVIPGVQSFPNSMPGVKLDSDYNPFNTTKSNSNYSPPEFTDRQQKNSNNWDKLYDFSTENSNKEVENQRSIDEIIHSNGEDGIGNRDGLLIFHKRYVLTKVRSGLMIIDRKRATERIYYERFLKQIENKKAHFQRLLFPQTLSFTEPDSVLLSELIPQLALIGYEIEPFGKNSFIVNSVPAEMDEKENLEQLFQGMLDLYRSGAQIDMEMKSNFAFSLARNIAMAGNKNQSQEELTKLIDTLFACNAPEVSPDGKAVVKIITIEELGTFFS